MSKIDYVQDNELADELIKFLQENNCSVTRDNDLLIVDESILKPILELFLKQTGRTKHKITFLEPDSYMVSIPVSAEEIGLETCEFCGYTSHTELVKIHRKTHQAL